MGNWPFILATRTFCMEKKGQFSRNPARCVLKPWGKVRAKRPTRGWDSGKKAGVKKRIVENPQKLWEGTLWKKTKSDQINALFWNARPKKVMLMKVKNLDPSREECIEKKKKSA